ncbi:MAG: hypothetical protein CSB47_04815 [Proteobacteria bacterium]|nr:MAG: hypothetical protein CSB47_04815 [Pseudomonadota bacterium]
MKLLSVLAALLLPVSTAMATPIPGPHQHGTLAVAVVKEDSFLTFKMVATSQDILGFEGSPKRPEQKKKLNEQYERLYKEEALRWLFQFVPVDACAPYSSNMDSDMLAYHEHDDPNTKSEGADDVHAVGDDNGHSDFELTYVFECDPVDRLQISFSDVFPSIKKVDFYGKGEFKGNVLRSVDASQAIISGEDLK